MHKYVKQTTTRNIFTTKEPDLFEDFFKLKDNNELSEDNVLDLELLKYLRSKYRYLNIKPIFKQKSTH